MMVGIDEKIYYFYIELLNKKRIYEKTKKYENLF